MTKSFYISLLVLVVGSGVLMASNSIEQPKPKVTTAAKPKPKTAEAKPKVAANKQKPKAQAAKSKAKPKEVKNDSVLIWYTPTEGYAKAKKEKKIKAQAKKK